MFTDHFFQKRVQPPRPALHIWMDIQTDGDYIKRVVHGPPGDHTLKKTEGFSNAVCIKSSFHLTSWKIGVHFKRLFIDPFLGFQRI